MNTKLEKGKNLSTQMIEEILDRGLSNSNWRNNHPEAYEELLMYRQDLEQICRHILTNFWNDIWKERIQ